MAKGSSDRVVLPEKYYHTYFLDMIRHIKRYSPHLLDIPDEDFMSHFLSLSEDAQCLFIRLSNRKGPFFRADKLAYAEINIPKALVELLREGFASEDPDEDPALLYLFTKQELAMLYPEIHIPGSAKKEVWIEHLSETHFLERLITSFHLVKIEKQDELEYLKLLFFGHYKGQMTDFVIRDVGHVRIETVDAAQFTPWFQTRGEAMAMYDICRLRELLNKALQLLPANQLTEWLRPVDFDRFGQWESSRKICDKLLSHIARQLERENQLEDALFFYRKAVGAPARERQVRLLSQLGRSAEAIELANTLLSDYQNASERIFATDFLGQSGSRIKKSTTHKIKRAQVLELTRRESLRVEQQVLAYYLNLGYSGTHSENAIWNNLFGLLFWEELFDASYDSFHSPLQRMASDVRHRSFFLQREAALKEKIKNYDTADLLAAKITSTFHQKNGIHQPMVQWHPEGLTHLQALVRLVPSEALFDILLEMAKNLKDNASGFPDLFVWKKNSYQFIEVKSPNDQLSEQQLFWIDFMQERKMNTSILRVSYKENQNPGT
ncbi:MAG: VRR-NUC domain-containing protein [Cyclobacteriaceae bacterium]|nr:VRR-NUC domain-containing protein [Cyclobacteriaceae bacterium]